jgi:small subunit ribosomal protein S17
MAELGQTKVRVGVVTSNAMDKTVTVAVERTVAHGLYKKTVKRTKKFKAHDKDNNCNVGDVVRIAETRPMSKTKRWRVTQIVRRAE